MNTIHFNVPPYIGTEEKYIHEAISNRKICGDGYFTKKCSEKLEEITGSPKVLMTTSGTSALEMAADRKSTRLNSSHNPSSRMPSSA